MLEEETLPAVFARHQRQAGATPEAVRTWGLELVCLDEREYSGSLTAVMTPATHDADAIRRLILDRFDMALGAGLGRLSGKVFRIGHLGDLNDLTLCGALCGVEMGLALSRVPMAGSGAQAALAHLVASA